MDSVLFTCSVGLVSVMSEVLLDFVDGLGIGESLQGSLVFR